MQPTSDVRQMMVSTNEPLSCKAITRMEFELNCALPFARRLVKEPGDAQDGLDAHNACQLLQMPMKLVAGGVWALLRYLVGPLFVGFNTRA